VVTVRVVVGPTDRGPANTDKVEIAAGIAPGLLRMRLATLLTAQLFDFGTFVVMVARHGVIAEMNPLVAHGLAAYGLPLLAAAKVALILLLGSIVVILGRPEPGRWHGSRLATVVALLAVAGGLVGGLSNVLVFAR
jgi:hypothetical protein